MKSRVWLQALTNLLFVHYLHVWVYFWAYRYSWNDLIVGAPFYFDRMKDHGGAVYIYMNENGSFQKSATVVLKGPSASGFGLAVAAIGDVNQDGFQGKTECKTFGSHWGGAEKIKWISNGKAANLNHSFLFKQKLHPNCRFIWATM